VQAKADAAASAKAQEDSKAKKEADAKVGLLTTTCFVILSCCGTYGKCDDTAENVGALYLSLHLSLSLAIFSLWHYLGISMSQHRYAMVHVNLCGAVCGSMHTLVFGCDVDVDMWLPPDARAVCGARVCVSRRGWVGVFMCLSCCM
jgi:hypothetical protein